MRTSQRGIDLIKSFEGCKLQSYHDQVGVLTIGYGHTGTDVLPGMTINQQTAEDLLRHDLVRFEDGITNLVKKPLNQNQFDALVCFSYNVGLGNLKSSTLLKDINAGLYKPAAEQFVKWDRAGGVEVAGLLRRRTAEQILFKSPVT